MTGINSGNKFSESGEAFIGFDSKGRLAIGETPDALGTNIFTGIGAGVSQELADITGSNLLSAGEAIEVLRALLTSDGARGRPEGIDNVAIVSLTEDAVVLSFDNGQAVDTLTLNFADGLLDQLLGGGQNAGDATSTYAVIEDGESIIGTAFLGKQDAEFDVGGSLKGEGDTETILRAAIDEDFSTVSLLGLGSDSFTVTIDRGAAIDTYTFTGDNAVAAIEAISNGVVNPGDNKDAFVFLSAGDSGAAGIGFANRYDGEFGGGLSVEELVEFVKSGDSATGVTVTDIGTATQIEFAGNVGTTDTIILDDSLLFA